MGLRGCPSEKKGKVALRCARASLLTSACMRTAPRNRGAVRLARALELTAETDSPLEEGGFELVVPL